MDIHKLNRQICGSVVVFECEDSERCGLGIVFDFVSKVNCTELRAVGSGQVADGILRVKGEFEDGVLGDCVEKVGRKSHIVSDVLD